MSINDGIPRYDEWTPQGFTIRVPPGSTRRVSHGDDSAETRGEFGVYLWGHALQDEEWMITHIPTGCQIEFSHPITRKSVAKKYVELLEDEYDDWDSVTADPSDEVREAFGRAKDRLWDYMSDDEQEE